MAWCRHVARAAADATPPPAALCVSLVAATTMHLTQQARHVRVHQRGAQSFQKVVVGTLVACDPGVVAAGAGNTARTRCSWHTYSECTLGAQSVCW